MKPGSINAELDAVRGANDDIDEQLNEHLRFYNNGEEFGAAEAAALAAAVKQVVNESLAFEKSKTALNRKIAKFALIGLVIAAMVVVALAISITAMLPLKEKIPLPILIDRNTGQMEVRDPTNEKLPPLPQMLDEMMLAQYVLARETYDWNMAQRNYDVVQLMSAPGIVFNEYDVFIHSPRSPLTVLGQKNGLKGEIIAVTPLDDGLIQFRLVKTVVNADGKPSPTIEPSTWVVTLRYELPEKMAKGMDLKQRLIDPFSYKVTYYNIVQETTRN
ncbi:type IV secretion system protein [Pseudomonas corrugata]|uniref:virB8 family protein n=1 Tax=Pseudomonas corrugata TaxID=47879 RepID=UPI0018E5B12C|nr:type IV secretion system protein [Pseudomonas corrugata]MBI6621568.1 type IV secretion system protein [Pseudomonas corrugata]MBI6694197.1 type IV secretion system protein [Pseudomonas corrugata]